MLIADQGERTPESGILLVIVGWIVAFIPHAFDEISGAGKVWTTIVYILAIWTITSLVTAFAYVAGRRLFSR
jgi:hypothetical protein